MPEHLRIEKPDERRTWRLQFRKQRIAVPQPGLVWKRSGPHQPDLESVELLKGQCTVDRAQRVWENNLHSTRFIHIRVQVLLDVPWHRLEGHIAVEGHNQRSHAVCRAATQINHISDLWLAHQLNLDDGRRQLAVKFIGHPEHLEQRGTRTIGRVGQARMLQLGVRRHEVEPAHCVD